MQILHIWDQAGVSCIYAKYQIGLGHKAKVIRIIDEKSPDKYGIYAYYNEYVIRTSRSEFVKKCLDESKNSDIIHVHGSIGTFFRLREELDYSKKIILHYHGTDVRGLNRENKLRLTEKPIFILIIGTLRKLFGLKTSKLYLHIVAQLLADEVLVSTPDLFDYVIKGKYIPIPVDLQHFQPDNTAKNLDTNNDKKRQKILTFNTEVTNIKKAFDYCGNKIDQYVITVYDRTKNPIMYESIPKFLKRYDIYMDIRFINNLLLKNLSSTALQSLACGLKVIDYKLDFQIEFPSTHDAHNVVSLLMDAYYKKREPLTSILLLIFSLLKN